MTVRPDARLMRLPERLSAHMQSRSQAGQVFISDAVMSLDAEMKSLHMAIQYASRATSLIQETEEQTGELLNLVNKIRSMARRMTLPDVRDAERQKTESEMNKLWGEVNKITGQEGLPRKSSEKQVSADIAAPISSKPLDAEALQPTLCAAWINNQIKPIAVTVSSGLCLFFDSQSRELI